LFPPKWWLCEPLRFGVCPEKFSKRFGRANSYGSKGLCQFRTCYFGHFYDFHREKTKNFQQAFDLIGKPQYLAFSRKLKAI